MTEAVTAPVIVVGIGNAMQTDDGLGLVALDVLAERLADSEWSAASAVELRSLGGEVTSLVEAWSGRDRAIVVDAIRVGGAPGSRYRFEVDVDPLPDWGVGTSSHSAGLAEAIAVARVLDRLPARLVIHGVEPADVGFGEELSPAVRDAVEPLVAAIAADLID